MHETNVEVGCGMGATLLYVQDAYLGHFGMNYNYLFVTAGACVYSPGLPEVLGEEARVPPPDEELVDFLDTALSERGIHPQGKMFP